jgi:hypothetical protein
MKPKDKAKELVSKMKLKMPPLIIPTISTGERQLNCDFNLKGNYNNAKQCALIAVDEVIENSHTNVFTKYWQEVKQEIENL